MVSKIMPSNLFVRLPDLPRHPCLELVSCSLQPLQRHVGRQLVTMEKCLSWWEHKLTSSRGEEADTEKLKLQDHDNFREKYFNEQLCNS